MSQENIHQDTPQPQAEEVSLEEAIFGGGEGSDNVESAFTDGTEGSVEEAAPVQESGQPAQGIPQEDPSNDDKRYQYWQSQADKFKNENAQLRNSLSQGQAPPQAASEAYQQDAVEEFPAPPAKPQRPNHFNREEAYSDPSSDSAKYLDAVESWRDDTAEYNTIRTQYDNAIMQEKFDKIEHEKVQSAQRFEARQAHNRQTVAIKDHVVGHYGFSDEQANDFMQKMSNPESLNLDNLVRLYQIDQGSAANSEQTASGPSDTFKQVQNAQQVPSPMGVMPSGQNNDGRSAEDKIMDRMIGNFNSKNPWK
jgi:hypothetical protein